MLGEVVQTLIGVITGIVPGFTAQWASVGLFISELSGTVSPRLRLALGPDTSRSGVHETFFNLPLKVPYT